MQLWSSTDQPRSSRIGLNYRSANFYKLRLVDLEYVASPQESDQPTNYIDQPALIPTEKTTLFNFGSQEISLSVV